MGNVIASSVEYDELSVTAGTNASSFQPFDNLRTDLSNSLVRWARKGPKSPLYAKPGASDRSVMNTDQMLSAVSLRGRFLPKGKAVNLFPERRDTEQTDS